MSVIAWICLGSFLCVIAGFVASRTWNREDRPLALAAALPSPDTAIGRSRWPSSWRRI